MAPSVASEPARLRALEVVVAAKVDVRGDDAVVGVVIGARVVVGSSVIEVVGAAVLAVTAVGVGARVVG